MRVATGGRPYAIGKMTKWGFRVRCIRFGKLHASYEYDKRFEEIRAVKLVVADKASKPASTTITTREEE